MKAIKNGEPHKIGIGNSFTSLVKTQKSPQIKWSFWKTQTGKPGSKGVNFSGKAKQDLFTDRRWCSRIGPIKLNIVVMKTISLKTFFAITLAMTCLSPSIQADLKPAEIEEARNLAKALFGTIPDQMPGSEKDTDALRKLGEKLYFETKLSASNTQSCNSCHRIDDNKAGVDNLPTSPGAFGENGDRNSPTVLNAGFHMAQFWDGRAPDLKEQAKGPVLNPIEMGMPDEDAVMKKLREEDEYKTLFAKAYPNDDEPFVYDNMAEAIAAFERTLITHDRFDDFLEGDNKALSEIEIKGLETFMNTGCTTCHNGPLLGGNMFQKIGLVNPYKNTADVGLQKVTGNEDDAFKFKVPSLRNVALTAPYLHDGSLFTLEETVRQMAWMQLGRMLTDVEAEQITAFLHALSDKERGGSQN